MQPLLASPAIDRTAARHWFLRNRNRTAELFSLIEPGSLLERPIPLRHPFLFYLGHIPAFTVNKLVREALGGPPINAEFEVLFERGIDPGSMEEATKHTRPAWPDVQAVTAYGAACDAAVLRALATADLTDAARSPLLERAEAAHMILEHEELHHETLLYILLRLAREHKRPGGRRSEWSEREPAARGSVAIAAGQATLGARRDAIPFGWDIEFEQTLVDVGSFSIDVNNVTNGEYLNFVRAGGEIPPFWIERDGRLRLRAMFGEIDLPKSWPVYVSNEQAAAYARWRGGRLPTEAEYHRAAFSTPAGDERPFPWGDEPATSAHGNFDFRRYDPEPVGISPAGASAWGVHDLIGNGWEWTSTPLAPLPGFHEMVSYKPYSSDFFDGEHYIIKGASPVTSRNLVRRSFRNWYRGNYPYMFATFRCVYD